MERVKNVSRQNEAVIIVFLCLVCVRISLAPKDGISPARCFISKCDIYHIGASRFKSYHGNFYSTHLPFTLLTSGVINRTVLYISHMRSRTHTDSCHSSQLNWHVFSSVFLTGWKYLRSDLEKLCSFYFVGLLCCQLTLYVTLTWNSLS